MEDKSESFLEDGKIRKNVCVFGEDESQLQVLEFYKISSYL